MIDNIKYDIRWSDSLDDDFISDFLSVQKEIFHTGSRKEFDLQFLKNIYGKSILVVVYWNTQPVAARGLWRNDIDGEEAYQPGSTCVLPVCRGKGIFTQMTMKAIEKLPRDSIIYNFPNHNSFPGYLKMGWNLLHDYSSRLYTSYKRYSNEHPTKMDRRYAEWWIKGRDLFYMKKSRHYFLLRKDRRPLCYHIIAEVNKDVALWFPRVFLALPFYKSISCPWYSKHFAKSHVVGRNCKLTYIPMWKIDAV